MARATPGTPSDLKRSPLDRTAEQREPESSLPSGSMEPMSALVPGRPFRSVEQTDPAGSVDSGSEKREPHGGKALTFTSKFEEQNIKIDGQEKDGGRENREREARDHQELGGRLPLDDLAP